jgi:hypothetical protein
MALQDRYVDRIASRECCPVLGNFTSPQNVCFFDREYFIGDAQGQLERGPDSLSAVNSYVPVQYLR